MLVNIPDKGMVVKFPDDMDSKEIERQIYTQVYNQDTLSQGDNTSSEYVKKLKNKLYKDFIEPFKSNPDKEAFKPNNPYKSEQPDISDVVTKPIVIDKEKVIQTISEDNTDNGKIANWLLDGGHTIKNIVKVYPVLETAATWFTNSYGMPLAGLAGILAGTASGPKFDTDAAEKVMKKAQELLIYQPKTKAGQELTDTSMYPFEKLQQAGGAVGEKVLEKTGSPLLATVAHTLIEGGPVVFGLKRFAPKVARKIQESNFYRKATIKERDLVVQSLEETVLKNPEMTEAELVKTSDQYFKEAIEKRKTGETQAENPITKDVSKDFSIGKDIAEQTKNLPVEDAQKIKGDMTPQPQDKKRSDQAPKAIPVKDNRTGGMTPEIIQSIPDPVVRAFAEGRMSQVKNVEPEKQEVKKEAPEAKYPDEIFLQKLDTMQNEVNETKTGGFNQQGVNQAGEDVRYSANSPGWMQELQASRKADKKYLLSRKDLNVLFDKVREGKPLTVRQQDQYNYLEKAINKYVGETAEFVAQEEAESLEKKGFDILGGQKVSVANLSEGDKFVGTVDGVKDEFTVKDTNEQGETLLQDGIAKRVDMFDYVTIDGIKKAAKSSKTIKETQDPLFGDSFKEPERKGQRDIFSGDVQKAKQKRNYTKKETPDGPIEMDVDIDFGKGFRQEPDGQGNMFTPSGQASTGSFADIPIQAMEMPEIVKLSRDLMQGKYPKVVKKIGRNLNIRGQFYPTSNGQIKILADLFKDPAQASKTLAHEIGHLVDYLDDKTMARGNILGRIASLKKYLKKSLEAKPGGFGKITAEDRLRIKAEAQKLLDESTSEQWVDEVITKEMPISPKDILDIWNSVEGSLNKDLLDYIKGLSSADKKSVVTAALKGRVPAELKRFATKVSTNTGKKIKVLVSNGKTLDEIYTDLINKELAKRKLITWEEVTNELKSFTQKWKPFDPTQDPKFTKYRFSPQELYADALSALITNPEYLKAEAPIFYEAFFNYLGNKPVAKEIYADIVAISNKTPIEKARIHVDDILDMFKRSTEKRNDAIEKSRVEPISVWDSALTSLWDKSHGVLKVVRVMEKIPGVIGRYAENARMAVQELQHLSSVTGVYLSDINDAVINPLNEMGYSLEELGVVGFYNRIAKGDRSDKANPLGIDKLTAEKDLSIIGQDIWGKEKFNAINRVLNAFRNVREKELYPVIRESSILPDKLMNHIETNQHHVKWDVAYYFDKILGTQGSGTARIFQQIGTLNEIDNPVVSTVLQDISLLRTSLINLAKQEIVSAFKNAKLIEKAPLRYSLDLKKRVPLPAEKGKGILTVFEKSEPGVPHYYLVSKDVSDMFNYNQIESYQLYNLWFGASQVTKELIVGKNIAWMARNTPRDFWGYVKNVPQIKIRNLPEVIKTYFEVLPEVIDEAYRKKSSKRIRAMKKARGLPTFRIWSSKDASFDNEIIRQLSEFKILSSADQKSKMIPEKLMNLWEFLDNTGLASEIWAKVAADKFLENRVTDTRKRARITRELAGTPDSKQKSGWHRITNSIFLFSEMGKAGIRQGITAFKMDKTGYAWKTFMFNVFPKIAKHMLLANGAILGIHMVAKMFEDDKQKQQHAMKFMKRMGDAYKRIPEWDLQTYDCIPIDVLENGKAVYLRFPKDYEGQVFGTLGYLTAKEIMAQMEDSGDPSMTLHQMVGVTSRQVPYNVHPFLGLFWDMATWAGGGNPTDWRGLDTIPKRVYDTGGMTYIKESWPYVWREWAKDIGLNDWVNLNYNDIKRDQEWYEQLLSKPGASAIGSYLKFSDRGISEKIRRQWELSKQDKAKKSLKSHKAVLRLSNGEIKSAEEFIKDITTPGVTKEKINKTLGLKADNVYSRMLTLARTDEERLIVILEILQNKEK